MGWGRVRAADLPARYNAAEILEHNLAERARKTALSGPAGERSFAEVADEANRVGNALRTLGLKPGYRVALLLPDLPECMGQPRPLAAVFQKAVEISPLGR